MATLELDVEELKTLYVALLYRIAQRREALESCHTLDSLANKVELVISAAEENQDGH